MPSIALCDRKLKLSVRSPTTAQPSVSKACSSSSSLQVVLTLVRWQRSGVPGVADLDAIDRRHDVVIARAADDGVGRQIADRPRQHVPVALPFHRVADVGRHRAGLRHRREPQLPQLRRRTPRPTRPSWCSGDSGSSRMPSRSRVTGFGSITRFASSMSSTQSTTTARRDTTCRRRACSRTCDRTRRRRRAAVVGVETNGVGGKRSRDAQRFREQRAADAGRCRSGATAMLIR